MSDPVQPILRRSVRLAEKNRKRKLSEDAAKQVPQKKRRRTNRRVPKRKDGTFYLAFVRVGLGDCAIISTPAGKSVMIDCGSEPKGKDLQVIIDDYNINEGNKKLTRDKARKTYYELIYQTLTSNKFLGNSNDKKLDLLILTHSDQDHHNLLNTVFPTVYLPKNVDKKSLQVEGVYHSGYMSTKYQSGYESGQTVDWLEESVNKDKTKINQVSLVDKIRTLLPLDKISTTDIAKNKLTDADNGRDAKAFKVLEEDNCTISILVSDLEDTDVDSNDKSYKKTEDGKTTLNDMSNDTNRGSVVTLIEVFDKKILICGDATIITEEYLYRNFKNKLANLDIMHVPHHGSANTSLNHPDFITTVKPAIALVSTGKYVTLHSLPSYQTLISYMSQQEQDEDEDIDMDMDTHALYSWYYKDKTKLMPKAIYKDTLNKDIQSKALVKNVVPDPLGSGKRIDAYCETTNEVWTTGSNGTQLITIKRNSIIRKGYTP